MDGEQVETVSMYSVIGRDGHIYGPVSVDVLQQWCRDGGVLPTTNLIDAATWRTMPARDVPELSACFGSTLRSAVEPSSPLLNTFSSNGERDSYAPQALNHLSPDPRAYLYSGSVPKQRVVAGVLALFLGAFGIHQFYLGRTWAGITMACLTLLTCGYGGIVTCVWALVDAVRCFTGDMRDAKDLPLV